MEKQEIVLSEREAEELRCYEGTDIYQCYREMRLQGTSHNLSLVLATHLGPAGHVGKSTSRPKQKLTNIRRKYPDGTMKEI